MKKMVCVLLAVMMIMTVACASACSVSSIQKATLKGMVNTANAAIRATVRAAQLTPYDDVDLMLAAVDGIVRPVKAYAAKIGAQVGCTYTAYVVDGRTVMVDPLYVINID
ncbi:MAG: hypothetical protein Q4G19_04850 [Clostridia bacterium]|nr:hypothetical protein [Clostridia bacterium]